MSTATTTPLAPAVEPPPALPRASETGAGKLPSEVIAMIISSLKNQREPSFCGRWVKKHGLAKLSLVCKQWYKAVINYLWIHLPGLRGAEDLISLREILSRKSVVETHALATAIIFATVTILTTETEPWTGHMHWLCARTFAHFTIVLVNPYRYPPNPSAEDVRLAPFRAIPRLPRTWLPIPSHKLTLDGLLFKHLLELDQLLYSLPGTVCVLELSHIVFAHPSPTSRAYKKPSRMLDSVKTMYCEGAPLSDVLMLAINRSRTSDTVFTLHNSTWSLVCKALLALLPSADIANVDKLDDRDRCLIVRLEVGTLVSTVKAFVVPPRPAGAIGEGFLRGGMDIWISLLQHPDEPEFAWDLWRNVYEDSPDAANLECLSILVDERTAAASKELLSLVLRRTHLTWALQSGKLRFLRGIDDTSISSADILASVDQHVIDGMTLTLDATEQAEWLLRYHPGPRLQYLRQLGRERHPNHSWEVEEDRSKAEWDLVAEIRKWHVGLWALGAEDDSHAQEQKGGAGKLQERTLSTTVKWRRRLRLRQLEEKQGLLGNKTGPDAGNGRRSGWGF